MLGKPNSKIEFCVIENIRSYLRNSKKSYNEILSNPGYKNLTDCISLPEEYDVAGPMFDEFCKTRMQFYHPDLDIKKYLKSTIVHPRSFSYDIVITYARKAPLFIELNNFYHYDVIPGKNDYDSLAKQLAVDFAKEQLLLSNGCRFLDVRTIDVDKDTYMNKIKKAI